MMQCILLVCRFEFSHCIVKPWDFEIFLHTPMNTYIYPPKQSMRIIGDITAQEVAFTIERDLKIDDFANHSFSAVLSNSLKRLQNSVLHAVYAKILKEKFNAKNPRSMQLKFHTQTSGESLTAQQPDNNIARVAIQSMAAVLGGTQSLHTNSRDEALALPTQASAKIALRTQQIVGHESGITKTADPMAGSHYVEYLCEQIEDEVWKYLKRIEKMGGSIKAIERGFFQSEIRKNAYRLKKEADSEGRVLVGVNKFIDSSEEQQKLLRVGEEVGIAQVKAMSKLRKSRNSKNTESRLSALSSAAEGTDNLMPYILDAVTTYATTGEISNTLRDVFGEYRPNEVF